MCSFDQRVSDEQSLYSQLLADAAALMEHTWFTNLANASAAIFESLPQVNWAGFYLLCGDELRLGPFQGRPACLRIPIGKGVCGTAATLRQTVVVRDVHEFPGHIACDARSRSEIVVPLVHEGRLIGVLDVDSPDPARFGESDRIGLEAIVAKLVAATEWPKTFV